MNEILNRMLGATLKRYSSGVRLKERSSTVDRVDSKASDSVSEVNRRQVPIKSPARNVYEFRWGRPGSPASLHQQCCHAFEGIVATGAFSHSVELENMYGLRASCSANRAVRAWIPSYQTIVERMSIIS